MTEHLVNTNRRIYKHSYYMRAFLLLLLLAISQIIFFTEYRSDAVIGFLVALVLIDGTLLILIYLTIWRRYKEVPLAFKVECDRLEILYKEGVRALRWDEILDCTPSRPWIIRLKNGERIYLKTVEKEIVMKIYRTFRMHKDSKSRK